MLMMMMVLTLQRRHQKVKFGWPATSFLFLTPTLFYIMAKANKFYTFLIMCTGMAVGSTAVNKVNI